MLQKLDISFKYLLDFLYIYIAGKKMNFKVPVQKCTHFKEELT